MINGLKNVGTYQVHCVVIGVAASIEPGEGADMIPAILPKHDQMKPIYIQQTNSPGGPGTAVKSICAVRTSRGGCKVDVIVLGPRGQILDTIS